MHILLITSEWPDENNPEAVPFLTQQVDDLRRSGVEIEVFSFRGAKHPLNYLKAWFELRSKYRFRHFDLIHAHWGQSGLIAIPTPIPLVVTFHGSDLQGVFSKRTKNRLLSKISSFTSHIVFRYAKQVIVVANRLYSYLPHVRKTHLIPCGIDFEVFYPFPKTEARAKLGLSMEKSYVLFPADPQREVKRFRLAKQAVSILEKDMNVGLLVLSGLPHSKVPLYMNASDVLVLTSHHEGSPTVIKEALACNLPIVSVDVGDVRERILGIDGCVLCEVDSPETIARGLKQVLERGKKLEGRETIQNLDGRKIAQKIIKVYRFAANRRQ